jgi:hypothetical protein
MTCEGCRFWKSFSDRRGTCFRYPPKIVDVGMYGELILARPFTDRNEFCGEFKSLAFPK